MVSQKALPKNNSDSLLIETKVASPLYTEFIQQWYKNCNERLIYGFLREWYEKTFEELPPEKPLVLIKLKIEYELLMRDWLEAKKVLKDLKIPKIIQENWQASKNFDTSKLKGITKGFTEFLIKQEKGEQTMVKQKAQTKKIEVKQAKQKEIRKTVTGEYEYLFRTNRSMTDKELAEYMCKQFPNKKKYTVEDVKAVRGIYNRGKLSVQNGVKPTTPAVCYDANQVSKKAIEKVLGPAVKVIKKVVLKKK